MWRLLGTGPAAGRILTLTVLSGVLAGPVGAGEPAQRPTNRLAAETSPYLLQHAHNPVDWYPWGPEAFARAKKEGKLVFLSVGYSSCHWCHVMERESFENPDVAKLLNQWFVCIKVDREERPDIDHVYMTALGVYGQSGGWPLSMFLTADGKPVFGGTYWPPDDREINGDTVRGFKSILKIAHDLQTEKPRELQQQADKVADATRRALAGTIPGVALVELNRDLVAATADSLRQEYDPEYGGFGSPDRDFRGPKFPLPCYLQFLQQEAARNRSARLAGMVDVTLERMARGGIYDQLGGGFHRYSTERTWTVPHFEKMLYDNAQLLEVYAEAYRTSRKPLYRRVLLDTLGFIRREMTAPEGGFYSALDADSSGAEGRFYVWTAKEIDAVLGNNADRALFKQVYGVDGKPNFEGQYYILTVSKPLADQARELQQTEEELERKLAPLRQKLWTARAKRPRPFLDMKILTGWNGQMIAGFALAGRALGEGGRSKKASPHVEAAIRAAEFVLKNLRTADGRLLRTYGARPGQAGQGKLTAYLDDYAYLVHGLLCLYDVTGDHRWLDEARALTDTMVSYHADKDGGFFYTANDHEKLFARAKDQYDSAQPSGNSVAARNLVRLWILTGEERYRSLAGKTFQAFAGSLKGNPPSLTVMAGALGMYLDAQPGGERPAAAPHQSAGGKVAVPTSAALVKVNVAAVPEQPGADGQQTVRVTLTIDKDWHIGANPAGASGMATTVQVLSQLPPEEVKLDYPPGKRVKDPAGDYQVYEGNVVIEARVRRARGDTRPLEVAVKFAACSDKTMRCLPPATLKRTVPAAK